MDFVDYYKQLGVGRSATQAEIKRAYRKLSRTYHPDVNKDPGAEDRFKEIAEAYEVLGDKDNREKYDRFGAAWKAARDRGDQGGPVGFEGFDMRGGPMGGDFAGATGFSEFFERLFGRDANPFAGGGPAGPSAYAAPNRRRGPHHEAELNLSIEDAYRGGRREVTLSDPQTGKSRKYVVTIPKGVREGQKIRLKGQGGLGVSGGPPGDILLAVKLESSSKVKLQGSDVHTSLQVSPWVAALGGHALLKTLDGEVKVKVPAGSSSGVRIRLKGKGYPRKSGSPGDLYAEIRIMVPKKLSRRERELFEELAEESSFEPDKD